MRRRRRRRRKRRTPGGQVLLMQPHCPKTETTKAGHLAVGQSATKEGWPSNKGPMKKGLPGNRQKQEEEEKKKKEEEERKLKEEEDKKKKEEDDKKKKEKDEEKEKHANEKAKEKPMVKEEDKKEEKTTLAQRVAAKKEALDERMGPKGAQEVDTSSSGESMSDDLVLLRGQPGLQGEQGPAKRKGSNTQAGIGP